MQHGFLFAGLAVVALNSPFVILPLVHVPGPGATGVLFTGFLFGFTVASAFGAISIAITARSEASRPRTVGSIFRAIPLFAVIVALGVPALLVAALGESPSPYWWVVYLVLLPGAIVVGSHIGLAGTALKPEGRDARLGFLLGFAVVGSVGPMVSTLEFFFSGRTGFASAVGFGLSGLSVACDLALVLWFGKRGASPG